jgi:hypothetical protein
MKKYRTTKKYQNGGKTTPTKPGTKPAAKATAAKKPTGKYMTEGERLGLALKKGDYAGAAKQVGEAVAGVPKELYGALKRSLR